MINRPEDVLERRVDAALGGGRRTPLDRAATMVLLVGAGSPEAADNAEVSRTARLLWEGRGYAGVETAFLTTAAPDVPAGLERCARLGARRIVVLTGFPADAALEERVAQQAEGWAEARPEVEVRHAPAHDGGGRPEPGDGDGEHDLRHHGDAEVRDGGDDLTDLAVNVRAGTPPPWLRERLAATLDGLAGYPDDRAAHRAVAARHGRPAEEVLLTAGAAEAFVLLARTTRARHAVVVHPQFTEPEAALRDAGHPVHRVVLRAADGFRLDPWAVPESADLVVVGNPTNPTSVLHPAAELARLARPGRTLVVDEAFMDAVPGEPESLAARRDLPGLVVLRSLTKTWGLAGLRVGYVLGDPERVAALRRAQPLWAVSAPGLTAAEACCAPAALAEAEEAARRTTADREHLLRRLAEFDDVEVAGPAHGPFVLLRLPDAASVRARLRDLGFAVRRADTFPGLSPDWLRLAVRDPATTDRLAAALSKALDG
ncbi:histidinol-phosphate aminotransferase [Actinacidiphila glaucinigra]|uniref:Aminotransferase n=1 Tax=Actinacidiphila glaucinigra TaxID=235986 RepID=A0A239A354_9ACTN|nr:histidinol-phosphate aminotransferase [Actinacidiphila glaucinigra]